MNELKDSSKYEAIIRILAHRQFLTFDYNHFKAQNGLIFDDTASID